MRGSDVGEDKRSARDQPHAGTDGGLDSALPFRSTLGRGPAGPLAWYFSPELGCAASALGLDKLPAQQAACPPRGCQHSRPRARLGAASTPGRVPAYGLDLGRAAAPAEVFQSPSPQFLQNWGTRKDTNIYNSYPFIYSFIL